MCSAPRESGLHAARAAKARTHRNDAVFTRAVLDDFAAFLLLPLLLHRWLAAAAIYAAALLTNEKVTQSEVSEVTDVSEVTIRNRYKALLESAEAGTAA